MADTLQRDRDFSVDLVKTCAILGVVVIHAATGAYGAPLGSGEWYCALGWGSAARASVPLFLMCTGALFLPPERELTLRRLWTRYIPRIAAALFFWAAVYLLYHLAAARDFSPASLLAALGDLLLFRHESHLYYLHMVLLIYALLPLLRLLTRHGDKGLLRYLLGLWAALGIVYPTLRPYWPFALLEGVPLQWMMNMTYASIGYCLLGYYLRRYPLRAGWAAASLGAGLGLVFGMTTFLSLGQGALVTSFWEGMSVGVCLMAAGLFSLLVRVKQPGPRAAGAAAFFSRASFCVYLTHMLFLYLLQQLGLNAQQPTPLLGIPLLALLAAAGSLAVYAAASRVPGVRRWLV